jgi:3-deoxy-D-manno-octulosonic-acid transferase
VSILQHVLLFQGKRQQNVRSVYNLLFYLLLPFILLRLLWRSLRTPEYRKRIPERLGFYSFALQESLWVHAVSVGESIAAIPLIKGLQQRYPGKVIVVTTMTPTGAARIKSALGDSITHLYIPYDFLGAVQRFFANVQPVIGIIMETELWPNLLGVAKARGIPLCLVNARLSAKSAAGYQRIPALTREMLSAIQVIAAHGAKDAERFIALGADPARVIVTGNIKFDLELPQDLVSKGVALREALGAKRFIWVAASTHEGEEALALAAHKKLCAVAPEALLILVPRHPNRFDAIYKLAEQQFETKRRSKEEVCTPSTSVYLGDTMGELLLMYATCDVALVAGSLVHRGGHNMLEAGALGKAILTGPYLHNFAEISDLFVQAQSLCKVKDADELAAELIRLLNHPAERQAMGERALGVVEANRGALAKQLSLVVEMIA